jgi:hypothetical protein
MAYRLLSIGYATCVPNAPKQGIQSGARNVNDFIVYRLDVRDKVGEVLTNISNTDFAMGNSITDDAQ